MECNDFVAAAELALNAATKDLAGHDGALHSSLARRSSATLS